MYNTPFDKVKNDLFIMGMELFDHPTPSMEIVVCPKCGTRLVDFLDTGFVNCANCYKVFSEYAKNVALDVHGRCSHIGKMPKSENSKASKKREIENLKLDEQRAVNEKKYTLANEIKMRIERLEEELK